MCTYNIYRIEEKNGYVEHQEHIATFLSIKIAKECVEKNIGDLYEGIFNTVEIRKMPSKIHYGVPLMKWIYEFDTEINQYILKERIRYSK